MAVKRRVFQLLRVPYDHRLDEGIQVLRYGPRQAYVSHMDAFDLGPRAVGPFSCTPLYFLSYSPHKTNRGA